MRYLAALLLAGTTLAIAGPAYALREPTSSKLDPHVGHVPYDADDVIHVPVEVGDTLAIEVAPNESIEAGKVAVSDRVHLRAFVSTNVLFLKATIALAPQPIAIRTVLPDGSARMYVFQLDAHEEGATVTDGQGVTKPAPSFYKVHIDYPREETAARATAWRRGRQQAAERRVSERLRAPASSFALNKRYVGQGDADLLPTREMWDDGQFTYARLPGHARIPGFWAVNPDGKEALVNDFNKVGDILSLPRTASAWHLRDGDAVLYVWNLAHSAVGNDTGTGTASPEVERTVKLPDVPAFPESRAGVGR